MQGISGSQPSRQRPPQPISPEVHVGEGAPLVTAIEETVYPGGGPGGGPVLVEIEGYGPGAKV